MHITRNASTIGEINNKKIKVKNKSALIEIRGGYMLCAVYSRNSRSCMSC